jgi:hypothetical protein
MTAIPYDRGVLVQIVIYHHQRSDSTCQCGWGQRPEHLGLSHAEHVADIYEASTEKGGGPLFEGTLVDVAITGTVTIFGPDRLYREQLARQRVVVYPAPEAAERPATRKGAPPE